MANLSENVLAKSHSSETTLVYYEDKMYAFANICAQA